MFSVGKLVILGFIITLDVVIESQCEHLPFLPPAPLLLYSPKDPEYLEVLVMRVGDNLTLICSLQAEGKPKRFVWNYLADGEKGQQLLEGTPATGPSYNSTLVIPGLQLRHSGLYVCTAPPYSLTKYLYVQEKTATCPRGALQCGAYCALGTHVCDGRADCPRGDDEAAALCHSVTPCSEAGMVACAGGGCVPARACCALRPGRGERAGRPGRPGRGPACVQHRCCDDHYPAGASEIEYPLLFEDRHVADDYGYIQSTIYTVTACALIFMIACVLLVSAICKMHMKRTALRTQHNRYLQARYPPCYSSRLLERDGMSTSASPSHTPDTRRAGEVVESDRAVPSSTRASGASRFGALFAGAYTQVPTHPTDVELQTVPHTSVNNSPMRALNRTAVDQSQAPNYCDDSTDFYFTNQEAESCSRDLNYMGTFDFFRRRALNRPLTLQLGRFQLSIPNFRRPREERRPDTPDIAEISIDDLNFVRVNSNDTYTLNGRSIRLLGANFENYPNVSNRPPTYNEAVRLKCGPPPEYLSTDVLTTPNEATSNVEMPPRYDEVRTSDSETSTPVRVVRNSVSLMGGCDGGNFSGRDPVVSQIDNHISVSVTDDSVNINFAENSANINVSDERVPICIDSNESGLNSNGQCVAKETDATVTNIEGNVNPIDSREGDLINKNRNEESNNNPIKTDNAVNQSDSDNQNTNELEVPAIDAAVNQSKVTSNALAGTSYDNRSLNTDISESVLNTDKCTNNNTPLFNNSCVSDDNREVSNGNDSMNRSKRFNEIIDNLPAIDSDVNANE